MTVEQIRKNAEYLAQLAAGLVKLTKSETDDKVLDLIRHFSFNDDATAAMVWAFVEVALEAVGMDIECDPDDCPLHSVDEVLEKFAAAKAA